MIDPIIQWFLNLLSPAEWRAILWLVVATFVFTHFAKLAWRLSPVPGGGNHNAIHLLAGLIGLWLAFWLWPAGQVPWWIAGPVVGGSTFSGTVGAGGGGGGGNGGSSTAGTGISGGANTGGGGGGGGSSSGSSAGGAGGSGIVILRYLTSTLILTTPTYATNALAVAGGLAVGSLYHTNSDPDMLAVVH